MLSIIKCKELLNDDLTQQEVELIRDNLYILAYLLIEEVKKGDLTKIQKNGKIQS